METPETAGKVMRTELRVRGLVQGVGFRPFVHHLATELGLAGFVLNDAAGVTIQVEGSPEAVGRFVEAAESMAEGRAWPGDLATVPPPLASVEEVAVSSVAPVGDGDFAIVASEEGGARTTLVSPDMGICDDCLAEIRNPAERRHGYAFTNCTNCGPRLTITRDVPYDRPATTMAAFEMCADCRREYEDPGDRRFHAQPIACPACGPHLTMVDSAGKPMRGDPLGAAADLIAAGRIVAVKGIGGYHLACDAGNEGAVAALRSRKVREDKPFALMARSVEDVEGFADVSAHERSLLVSPRRPIVLLARRAGAGGVGPSVAPRNAHLGFMLPYTPLHHLLLDALEGRVGVLVMTSANLSDEPIAFVDSEALARLGSIADAFLMHNRPIHIRCDDTVTRSFAGADYPVRRSRGYAPEPMRVTPSFPVHVLAAGAELKHTFCLGKDDHAFVSHHIGDLENYETLRSFEEGVEHYCRVFDVAPRVVAHDLHPQYLSTSWALAQVHGEAQPVGGLSLEGARLTGVQHHHAHIASCCADNQIDAPVIGLALDGTGWCNDGTIWGCEILLVAPGGYTRMGHLRYVPLPGGARAIKEPWRMGAVYLDAAYGADASALDVPFVRATAGRWGPILQMARTGVGSLPASSAGRLFDAVAAIAGIRSEVNYEGQAAIELEQAADPAETLALPCGISEAGGMFVLDGVELVRWCSEELARGTPVPCVAAGFHNGLAGALVHACMLVRERSGNSTVALSGGTFMNLLLTARTSAGLEAAGFTVLRHRRVPAGDGGISLGQAVVAAARVRAGEA